MPIYNIFNAEKNDQKKESAQATQEHPQEPSKKRDRFFSSLAARLFFLLLLVADVLWGIYSACMLLITTALSTITFFRLSFLKNLLSKTWISFKRSLVCAISLFVALFSPSFGIMIACTYFLMFDRAGIDEVVPASLQEQFKEFFPSSSEDVN